MANFSFLEMVLAWIGVGLAASIAGMIWPFKRGVVGVAVNAATGIGGAVIVAGIGYALGLYAQRGWSIGLILAAVGAIGALVVLHLAWAARVRHAHAHPRHR